MIDAEELVEPAPGAGPLSTLITERPLRASSKATEAPITPAPMTTSVVAWSARSRVGRRATSQRHARGVGDAVERERVQRLRCRALRRPARWRARARSGRSRRAQHRASPSPGSCAGTAATRRHPIARPSSSAGARSTTPGMPTSTGMVSPSHRSTDSHVADAIGVEAHLRVAAAAPPGVGEQRLLGVERVVQHRAVDERVAVGIAGDADPLEPGVVLEQIAQERQRVLVRPGGSGRRRRSRTPRAVRARGSTPRGLARARGPRPAAPRGAASGRGRGRAGAT